MPANAAPTACSMSATNVTTVRLCETSDETSRMDVPFVAAIASTIFATISGRLPSEKFGTHSTSFILERARAPRSEAKGRTDEGRAPQARGRHGLGGTRYYPW